MIQKIKKEIEGLNLFIKSTINDRHQFETNCKNTYMSDELKATLETLEKWEKNIGKNLFKRKNSFYYSEKYNSGYLNETEETFIFFSNDLYNKFQFDYIENLIKYHSKNLIEQSITCNSTNKLTNLQFEWELEMNQKIIKFYKRLLGCGF